MAVEPDSVSTAGEKLQDAHEGNPEQDNEAFEVYPFCGVKSTVVVALCPAVTVSEAGETLTEKYGDALE